MNCVSIGRRQPEFHERIATFTVRMLNMRGFVVAHSIEHGFIDLEAGKAMDIANGRDRVLDHVGMAHVHDPTEQRGCGHDAARA